jgi:DNA repair ATPase RecN
MARCGGNFGAVVVVFRIVMTAIVIRPSHLFVLQPIPFRPTSFISEPNQQQPRPSSSWIIGRMSNMPKSSEIIYEHENNSTLSSSTFKTEFRIIEAEELPQTKLHPKDRHRRRSRISRIKCRNLGGMGSGSSIDVDDCDDLMAMGEKQAEVVLDFNPIRLDDDGNHRQQGAESPPTTSDLVAVTGETGSGKSLLVSKAVDLVTGGKASSSMLLDPNSSHLSGSNVASVEMELSLDGQHIKMLKGVLEELDIDPDKIISIKTNGESPIDADELTSVQLRREISPATGHSNRIKSSCFINNHPVTLKALKVIGVPLVALVNAPVAASALGRDNARMSMIDVGVPIELRQWVHQLHQNYKKCRNYRKSLERELEQQVLPISLTRSNDKTNSQTDKDLELLRHWTEELDGFESRILDYIDSLVPTGSSVLEENGSELAVILLELIECDWGPDSPNMYKLLLDLSDSLKALDGKIDSAMKARDALCSLSTPDSALTALERTRRYLTDTQKGQTSSHLNVQSKDGLAAEHAHDLLNQVEEAIATWSSFMDDDDKGLVGTLKATRNLCATTMEQLTERITEWNTLARKHGISSPQLPLCHSTLKKQLDGGLEAKLLLPKAREAESAALLELQEGYQTLTETREKVCRNISNSISRRLPSLGFGNSSFEARLRPMKNPSYGSFPLGADEIDFLLHHDGNRRSLNSRETKTSQGGKLEDVASSGEKARILLAIECEIPGSIRALCGSSSSSMDDMNIMTVTIEPPVAVIYDEIDAHVGGNASVAVAQMLFDQSRSCQVLSITHSPSVAAVADVHVCIRRHGEDGKPSHLSVSQVRNSERVRELARILSGDMATDEAEAFAIALLREASAKKATVGLRA